MKPFIVHRDEARTTSYNRLEHGIDATSHELITSEHSRTLGFYVANMKAPIDYSSKLPQEIILYFLEGIGTITVGGETFDFRPGSAVLIPPNVEHHHVSNQNNTFTIIWSPPPGPGPRH